ncbi:thermostable hemolysin [Idiomarina piscisalsi]|uniref:Thermostable hemolysin-like protein n=1 Tax=Idiomarina piscisalsi TaxID=1096243 RepID=A0A432YX55_9GAMM|nr:thermostable hemolysin [Idiomarina piscisalsi]RUO67903.1 thermostable hemolysin-like protein [Idiomarina piscisalsi]
MHHCWILPEHPLREQVETFICERYWLNFHACLRTLPRLLIAVFEESRLVAACGVQLADEQALFSQAYLTQPLENYRVSNKPLPQSENLAEVGSMAALTPTYLPHLFRAVVRLLDDKGRDVVIFTATRALQKYFRRIGVALTELETAQKSALPESVRDLWGNYYQHQPTVLAGWLTDGNVFEQMTTPRQYVLSQQREVAI